MHGVHEVIAETKIHQRHHLDDKAREQKISKYVDKCVIRKLSQYVKNEFPNNEYIKTDQISFNEHAQELANKARYFVCENVELYGNSQPHDIKKKAKTINSIYNF